MKNALGLILLGVALGSPIGAFIQERCERPKIIDNGAGHYDMITGDFEWGSPPKLAKEAMNAVATDFRSMTTIDKSLANALKETR